MATMPKGPFVSFTKFSATSWIVTAIPKVAIAR